MSQDDLKGSLDSESRRLFLQRATALAPAWLPSAVAATC